MFLYICSLLPLNIKQAFAFVKSKKIRRNATKGFALGCALRRALC